MAWRKIASNTLYQLIGKGVGVLANIVTVALITRTLGPAGFGDYVLAITIPFLLYLFVDFGLNAVYLREVFKDDGHIKKFGSLLFLRANLAVIFFLFGVIYVFFSPYHELLKLGILVGITSIFSQSLFTSLNALFQHNLRYDLSVLAGIFSSLIGVVLVVLGFLGKADLLFFVSVWVVSSFVLAGLAFVFSQRLPEKPRLSFDRVWARRLFLISLPLGLMVMFTTINSKIDIFLLSLFDTSEAVGIYGLGRKVFDNLLTFPIFFVNALYPVLLRDQKHSLSIFWSRLTKGVLLLFSASLLLAFLGFAFSPFIIRILGGEGFEASDLVLRVLVLSLPFFFVTAPLQWSLIVLGKEKVLPVIYGIAALSTVVINFIFIPRFSYFASIFATIFAELLILVLLIVVIRRFKSQMLSSGV